MDNNIVIGNLVQAWQSGRCISATLCVTENCNMACKYCYMIHKNNKRNMSYEMAIKIINFIMTNEEYLKQDAIVFDFIGGEPLLQIDMIDKVCDYIVTYMYNNNHKWFDKYRFMITTNGLLYGDERVQKFLKKHMGHVSVTISIDGTKEKQDTSRVRFDGSGTYDDVVRNIPLWLKQFPTAFSKATFSHEDLPYLKDSIIHLWSLGIKTVMANIVYEDVWKDGDDRIFEDQLNLLADYVIDNNLWDKFSVRFFNPNIGLPLSKFNLERNVCGAGVKTVAFDCDGEIFPCIRFLDFCMNGENSKSIGNISSGVVPDKIKAFSSLTVKSCMDNECSECDIAQSCDFCTAYNYLASKEHTIYERTKYNCKMHKANVRANNRLWYKYSTTTGSTSLKTKIKLATCGNETLKYLKIILSDKQISHCAYKNNLQTTNEMSDEMIEKAIDYCYKNFLIPIFIGNKYINIDPDNNIFFKISSNDSLRNNDVYIYNYNHPIEHIQALNYIITINRSNIECLSDNVMYISKYAKRINIFIEDLKDWTADEVYLYSKELEKIVEKIKNNNINIKLNILERKEQRCGAGISSITLAPDGNFYLCPAFYFNGMKDKAIGNIYDEDFTYKPQKNLRYKNFYQEKECNNHLITSCVYNNFICTGEVNVSSYVADKIEDLHHHMSEVIAH